MTIDGQLAGYVREHWAALVDEVSARCIDAEPDEAEQIVLQGLTRVGVRWRWVSDKDDPDSEVRRSLDRACVDWERRRPRQADQDILLMDIGPAGHAPPSESGETRLPPSGIADPVAVLAGRIRRRQQRGLVAASVAAVAVALLATTALTGSRSRGGSPHPSRLIVASTGSRVFPTNALDFATGVAAGGGYIWTLEERPTRVGSSSYVVERDPHNGKVETRYRVPAVDDQIGYGLGQVWTWRNSNDGRETVIATLEGHGQTAMTRSTPSIAIASIGFTPGQAWLTEPGINKVVMLHGGLIGGESMTALPHPQFVVPLSGSSVLVAGNGGDLSELPGSKVVSGPGSVPVTLLAPAPSYGIWIGHDRVLTYQPRINVRPRVSLTLPFRVGAVTGDPQHGVYVALRSDNPLHHDPYLVYYSPAALAHGQPRPTARLDGDAQAESMAADPAGGVVFTTNQGTVGRWNPVSVTLR